MEQKNVKKGILVFVRYALAITFLSAVADRFGFWGAPGEGNVAWGSWSNFLDYTALLNPWAPKVLVSFLGSVATLLEVVCAIGLIIGMRTKIFALGSAVLLSVFALSMTFTLGIKSPLDYSVFSASGAALLLFLHYD